MRENKSSYEWVTLRSTNIRYISDLTGKTKAELKTMLEAAKAKGKYEVRIPLNTAIFTREER